MTHYATLCVSVFVEKLRIASSDCVFDDFKDVQDVSFLSRQTVSAYDTIGNEEKMLHERIVFMQALLPSCNELLRLSVTIIEIVVQSIVRSCKQDNL